MKLNEIRDNRGAHYRAKRVGRGIGSGKGKTSGRGGKGQTARTGVALNGFEGGQTPLHRRLPKRGFNNKAFKTVYAIVNVDDLEQFDSGVRVNRQLLEERGLIKGRFDGIKILGRGKLTKSLTVEAHKLSATARQQIEEAGGSVVPVT